MLPTCLLDEPRRSASASGGCARIAASHSVSLAEPGLFYAHLSRIEVGQRVPSEKALRKLAAKLDVAPRTLSSARTTRPARTAGAPCGVRKLVAVRICPFLQRDRIYAPHAIPAPKRTRTPDPQPFPCITAVSRDRGKGPSSACWTPSLSK
jgi:hypothetical protein